MRTRLAVLLTVAFVLVGCSSDDDPEPATTTTTTERRTTTTGADRTTVPAEPKALVSVYFLQDSELMVGEGRQPATKGVIGEAVRALLEGPDGLETDLGLHSEIPDGTKLLGVDLAGGVATVDLTGAFGSGGGSQSMQARVAQVVYTATQFSTVDRVRFHLDGKAVDAIGGEGVVVEEPLARDDFEFGGQFGDASLVPPVLLERPRVHEQIESPVRLTGSANVFEATFRVQVVDGDGRIVAEQAVMAGSGSGERGTFDASVAFEPEQAGTGAIMTFVPSAKDGSRDDVREVPVLVA